MNFPNITVNPEANFIGLHLTLETAAFVKLCGEARAAGKAATDIVVVLDGVNYELTFVQFSDAIRRAAAPQGVQAEPVAYIEHHKGGDNLVWEMQKSSPRCTPLYTHPAPAAPAQEPATREARLRTAMDRMDRDGPLPGMISAFETEFGGDWTDPSWRQETAIWASAWRRAASSPAPAVLPTSEAVARPSYDDLVWCLERIKAASTSYDTAFELSSKILDQVAVRRRYEAQQQAASQPEAVADLVEALQLMYAAFPAESDLWKSGWARNDVEEARVACVKAVALIAKHGQQGGGNG